VLKARSTILGTLGILNFRHLLNAALRSINYMAIFMQTFVRGAIFIGAHEVFSGGSLTESFVNYIRDNVQR
jgi:hypothetical protein